MKKYILFLFILFSIGASAHQSEISILKLVLSDSTIAKYLSGYGEIDSVAFVLSESSGNYFYNEGDIKFKENNSEEVPTSVGIIKKIKSQERKAVVKIYFKGNNTFYTKVKLNRYDAHQPWLIKSRLLYNPFLFFGCQSRIFHYSIN